MSDPKSEPPPTWASAFSNLNSAKPIGRIESALGLTLEASLPTSAIGDLVEVQGAAGETIGGEVIGFRRDLATIMAFGSTRGISRSAPVRALQQPLRLRCGPDLLGRVVDALGNPMDGLGDIGGEPWELFRKPPNPLSRPRIDTPLSTGIRAIDGTLTLGHGQRVGLFAGSGVGKTSLLGQIARQTEADVFVVCLIGERGREVRTFIEDHLGDDLARGVVVCASSDAPPLLRMRAAHTATAIAEWFRDEEDRNVLLLVDSITRFARAAREVGLAAGEPPTRRGFPPSVFAALPELVERTGRSSQGSITSLYTVLVEGDDLDEPIADEIRGILDGHIVLSRELANQGHFPPIDVLKSQSRLLTSVAPQEVVDLAQEVRRTLALLHQHRDLIDVGAYQPGVNHEVDRALARKPKLNDCLRQGSFSVSPSETVAALRSALSL